MGSVDEMALTEEVLMALGETARGSRTGGLAILFKKMEGGSRDPI